MIDHVASESLHRFTSVRDSSKEIHITRNENDRLRNTIYVYVNVEYERVNAGTSIRNACTSLP